MPGAAAAVSLDTGAGAERRHHLAKSRAADTDGLQSGGAPAAGSAQGAPGQPGAQYKFYFNIGSIDSFERKMEEAQEDLGWAPGQWVPITYTNELSWQQVTASHMCHITLDERVISCHGALGSVVSGLVCLLPMPCRLV